MNLVILASQVSPYHNARFVGATRHFDTVHVVSTANAGDFPEFLAKSLGEYALHRLFDGREAYTAAANDMQRRMSPEDIVDKPRALPPVERGARLKALREKLSPGIEIRGELEPSDALVDKFVSMQEAGVLRYISWEYLTQRHLDIRGKKKVPGIDLDNDMRLRVAEVAKEETVDNTTDLKLVEALQRRGAALEIANLMSFSQHQKLIALYRREYARDPLPDFHQVSWAQIQRADEEVFVRFAEETRDGLPLGSDGRLALDKLVDDVLKEHRITACLAPKQKPVARPDASSQHGGGGASRSGGGGGDKRMANELNQLKAQVKKLKAQGPSGKGQGKGPKGGGKSPKGGSKGKMPSELVGLNSHFNGKPICYAYNCASGCLRSVDNLGSCGRGQHVCARCGGNHPAHYQNCPKRG